ncbi:Aklavinone 12-hydroxylase RdmE [Nocardia cerradoensis]|uniref:Aklavinone 12-hydroxylase RdmE n=1 Tax=Nocardia cerradoensis TaxID=85688 RepID=A0A231GXW3_9NOCA|nr:FAD-dependent monooxygenase [Nocardia cerradoensis]OXR41412.1 Aklavinone 12-hydroxylase RdmE [Nocardia cerradoensis]
MMYDVHADPVLIVGGGLTGLTAALFLKHQGVPVVLVERRTTTSAQPKARRINIRTMELFRRIGIAEAVEQAARGLSAHQAMAAGPTLARAQRLPFTFPGGLPDWDAITPASACLCAQDRLEPVLRELAQARGCDIRFGVECVDIAEDATGLTATLRTGPERVDTVRASYLVAADGAQSPLRERLNIGRHGRGTLGRAVNVYFRADLAELVRGREFNLCQIENDRVPGAFASVDGARRWIFTSSAEVDRPAGRWPELLREAIGVPDIDVEVLSVLPWEPGMFIADTFRSGRVFLAGDAAHVMPPYAAAGANTGIQDGHNLAWKLALVLRGAAPAQLLDSYDSERRPVGRYIADQSSIRTANLRTMARESTDGTPLADPIALILGTRYPAGAFIDDDSPHTMDHLDLTGQPGTRLPHRYLADGRSTLDLVGTTFTLLIGPDSPDWRLGDQAVDIVRMDRSWCATVGATPTGALLVRPDQVIAWRVPAAPDDPAAAVRRALSRILNGTGHAIDPAAVRAADLTSS